MNIDPQQERRRLRAALESMQRKRRLAMTGFVMALGLVVMGNVYGYMGLPQSLLLAMQWAAPFVFFPFALPFLRALCPKCNGRYQSPGNMFRHPEHMPPCKSCGFSIDKHISMY